MKKFLFLVLTLCMVFNLVPANVYANSNNIYKYTITPDSDKWAKYNPSELVQLTDIPKSIVKDMNTLTLISAVMDYPFIGDIYAFDSSEIGIQVISERFSGLKELFRRSDAGDGLFENYMTMKQEVTTNFKSFDFEKTMKYRIIGTLLSEPVIFKQLNKAQVDSIVEASNIISKKIDVAPAFLSSVRTPNGSDVPVDVNGELLTSTQKNQMDQYIASRYPLATKLRTATTMYNCHSYAWYTTSSSNIYWMPSPALYMSDGSYTNVGSRPTASGQKMYYPLSTYEHSAIVNTASTTLSNIVVTSKWGQYGLYKHKADSCPYYRAGVNYSFWRR